jgi:hypothetical protein
VQKSVLRDVSQLETKIERATEGVRNHFITRLANLANKANAFSIANFIMAARIESNISDRYRVVLIFTLCKFSDHVNKNFKDCTREDNSHFLIFTE